jgi:uncharacterized protein YukE
MPTFLGCDPVQLGDTALLLENHADDVTAQTALLDQAADLAWEGADADRFREDLDALRTGTMDLTSALESMARQLREEADQQEQASRADPTGIRRIPGNPLDKARHLWALPAPFSAPAINRGFARWRERMPQISPSAVPDSDGEPWISPEEIEDASHIRHLAVGKIPGAKWVQTAVDVHTDIGHGIDEAEHAAQDLGIDEELSPVLGLARGVHGVTGHAVGQDDSIVGTILGDADVAVANTGRTIRGMTDAVMDGDPGGVAAALETGLVYNSAVGNDVALELLTNHRSSLAPAHWIGSGAQYLADGTEGHVPEAVTDYLRTTGRNAEAGADTADEFADFVTDPEAMLESRRENLSLPWDR